MTPEEKIRQIKNRYSGKIKIIQQKVALKLAQGLVDYIKLRTREEGEGTSGKLDPLSKKYIEQRIKKSNRLHPDTSPSKSNLTATGQMLDALRGRAGGGKVTIDIKPTTRRKELNGKKSGLTNNEVRQYVEDAGREFLKLSPDEKKDVIDLATQLINEELASLS
ncbi:MAG: hypothetical protein HUM72_12515 [Dolichospermum sp.]|nr:hypothetical protein [Dolichospermum sp.]